MTAMGSRVSAMTSLDAVDDLVYQREDAFELAGAELADLRRNLLRGSVAHHLGTCPAYHRYAEANGWSDAFLDAEDLPDRIPLLPASVFKRRDVVSGPPDRVVKVCTSSGTQGSRSRVHRDSTTMERFLGSIDRGADLLLVNRAVERRLLVLGPDTDEAADLWFSYVLSIVDLLYPTDFFVRAGALELDRFVAAADAGGAERPLVIGPPVLIRDAARRLLEQGVRPAFGDRGGLVVTAGGWKTFDDQALPREEFTELVAAAFGLADLTAVRDCYNAVELNTVLFECEHRSKHVPAWLYAGARDPVTQRPLPPGQVGPLAFCDTLPTSYPGFVLTDDLGSVSTEGACPCGRAAPVLTIGRRIRTVEARGCALTMDRTVSR